MRQIGSDPGGGEGVKCVGDPWGREVNVGGGDE